MEAPIHFLLALLDIVTEWLVGIAILFGVIAATAWAIHRTFRFELINTVEIVGAGLVLGVLGTLGGILPCGVVGLISLPGLLIEKALRLGSLGPLSVAMTANIVVYTFACAIGFRLILGGAAARCPTCGATYNRDAVRCDRCVAKQPD